MQDSNLVQRVAALEAELERIKQYLPDTTVTPWWQDCLGTFENDPAYDDAMQLGQDYRESLRSCSPVTDP